MNRYRKMVKRIEELKEKETPHEKDMREEKEKSSSS